MSASRRTETGPVCAARPAAALSAGASPLARAALLAYSALLVYGSLSPWQGWRSLGVGPFAFLVAPWPAYITTFDLVLNFLAYLPLGMLLVLSLFPRLRGLPAFLVAVAAAAIVSILIEALQSYLPVRVASNVDVLTNATGAAVGAAVGALLAPTLVGGGQLQQVPQRWFRPRSASLLIMVALWPLAQIHPGPMLFGNGELDNDLVARLVSAFGFSLPTFDASRFAAAEVLTTACAMLAAGGALSATLRRRAPRVRLLLVLLGAALATKAITYGHEFGPDRALAWLSAGATAGLAAGLLGATAVVSATSARAAMAVAAVALLALIVTVNAAAPNPYHLHWLAAWQPGRLRDVAAASVWLAQGWPFAALAVLAWSLRRRRQRARQGQWRAIDAASVESGHRKERR